eukprot:4102780-Karenia_brevis.AAC.1
MVLQAINLPMGCTAMISKLYNNARHFLRFAGCSKYAFTPLCGTKQGCPMSGTLFAIILDPIIAALQSVVGPRDILRGYADDLAAVLHNGLSTLRGIAKIYDIVLVISGLRLKVAKTILIPLRDFSEFQIRARISEVLPAWTRVQIKRHGRYLGFFVGAVTDGASWESPTSKMVMRAQQIKMLHAGLNLTSLMYNSLAVTCTGFVAQLEIAPARTLAAESKALQRLTSCPRYAITNQCLHHLAACGMPVSFTSLRAMNLAALYRTARSTAKDWRQAQKILNDFRDHDDDCTLALYSGLDTTFDRPAIVDSLQCALSGGEVPLQVVQAVNDKVDEALADDNAMNKSVIQKAAYGEFVKHVSPFRLDLFLSRRLQRWPQQFQYMPSAQRLASRARRNLLQLATKCVPCIRSAVLKTYAYGWLTGRRFNNDERRDCILGCTRGLGITPDMDPTVSDDSLEHYMCCPHIQEAWHKFSRLHNSSGPLGMLGLADEPEEIIIARLVFLY